MKKRILAEDVLVLEGAVNTGVLRRGDRALLIDCCDRVTPAALARLGVRKVERILLTQPRRPNVAGVGVWARAGAVLSASAGAAAFLEKADAFWADWRNHWYAYAKLALVDLASEPLAGVQSLADGDVVEWEGFRITALATPGMTDGALSYEIEAGGRKIIFCGDLMCGNGGLWDLHSLQKAWRGVGDYHGFPGGAPILQASLARLGERRPGRLVPSHGAPVSSPLKALALLSARLEELVRNCAGVSALNHYFPKMFEDLAADPLRLPPAEKRDLPPWVRRAEFTSFALVSDTGAAFLIDCGHDRVLDTLSGWMAAKAISSVDGCWVTHYHYDHVDALPHFVDRFKSPVLCDASMAEVMEHPNRFFLPCLTSCHVPVKATADGESWRWHEFTMTAFHFPGQSVHHGGLLVEGHGVKVFFAGDSGAPTGLDDYCAPNRVFLGKGRGSRQCLALLRRIRPDYIVNQHQEQAFRYTDADLDRMEAVLESREQLVAAMTPWEHPDFALDPGWLRAYPYLQEAGPGSVIRVTLRVTNHASVPGVLKAEPVLPAGWRKAAGSGRSVRVEAGAEGELAFRLVVPETAGPGPRVIPFRAVWNGRYLGAFRHARVDIWC